MNTSNSALSLKNSVYTTMKFYYPSLPCIFSIPCVYAHLHHHGKKLCTKERVKTNLLC